MGLRNLRAICPNCGGKIHTQAKGIGKLTWANSWFLVETGTQCQWCSQPLTGKVKANGHAVAADAPKSYGAGPVMTTTAAGAAPAETEGWWPDPTGRHEHRYFDGLRWTWRVRNGEHQTNDKAGAPATTGV